MRIGLIARDEYARGLAIQSKSFYDHIPVAKVLLIKMPRQDCVSAQGWYDNVTPIAYDGLNHTLDQQLCREWMADLDVVFTVETTYDWNFPIWARQLGVKTVIQGNPEFYRHDQEGYEHQGHPDAWWWPTPWLVDRLPRGQIMPVPMPDREPSASHASPPRFLHVVGKRAYADRNGTDIFLDAIRGIEHECDVTVHGIEHELPEISLPLYSPVHLAVERIGVPDRWSMYDNQSVLVLPRRYGGLCLPALEAAACGLGVLMSDVSPNEVLASAFVVARNDRPINLARGPFPAADVNFADLTKTLNMLCENPEQVALMQERSLQMVPRWSEYREIYMEEFRRVCEA